MEQQICFCKLSLLDFERVCIQTVELSSHRNLFVFIFLKNIAQGCHLSWHKCQARYSKRRKRTWNVQYSFVLWFHKILLTAGVESNISRKLLSTLLLFLTKNNQTKPHKHNANRSKLVNQYSTDKSQTITNLFVIYQHWSKQSQRGTKFTSHDENSQ